MCRVSTGHVSLEGECATLQRPCQWDWHRIGGRFRTERARRRQVVVLTDSDTPETRWTWARSWGSVRRSAIVLGPEPLHDFTAAAVGIAAVDVRRHTAAVRAPL